MHAVAEDESASDEEAVKISLRAPRVIRDKIDRAAKAKNVTRTEFMLRASATAAEEALLDQCLFSLEDEQWERFNEALNAPLPKTARLKRLLRKTPLWER